MSAVIATVSIAAIGTGYAIYSAEQQKKKMEEAAKKQDTAQRGLEAEAKARSQNEEAQSAATEARNVAATNQRRKAGQSRSGTLMTSPLSSLGNNLTNASSGKSLIGQ